MARKTNGGDGNLQQALTLLIQSQASLVQNHASFLQNQTSFLSQLDKTHERLARIERDLEQIKAILLRHEQMLTDLPEAIRQKIGFKAGSGPAPSQPSESPS